MVARFRRGKKIADRRIGLKARLRMPCNGSVLPRWGAASCAPTRVSDAAGDVGEVEPDFDAAEVRAFGADRSGDAGAEMAGRADVTGELGMDFAELGDFVHGGLVDFFLGIEAGTHGPFVEKMEERTGFVEADGLGVGE